MTDLEILVYDISKLLDENHYIYIYDMYGNNDVNDIGEFQILEVVLTLFLEKKNISSYIGPLVHGLMKRVRISSTYVLV